MSAHPHHLAIKPTIVILLMIALGLAGLFLLRETLALKSTVMAKDSQNSFLTLQAQDLQTRLDELNQKYADLSSQDQLKINQDLSQDLKNIKSTYSQAVKAYEDILSFKEAGGKNSKIDQLFSQTLTDLSLANYSSASASLSTLSGLIKTESQKLTASVKLPQNLPVSNAPPSSGYARQKVTTDSGEFMVSLVAANLSDTKVIVDTASDSDCSDNCPVLPLSTFISRSGAYAGINGAYFCPAAYPSCAGKANSFDLLIMNKNKYYFNSSNNVYSSNPAVIFGGSYIRFVDQVSQWGRDTGVDGVLSNYPLLVYNSQVRFSGNDDAKMTSKGTRAFVGNIGNKVFIGMVHNATVPESAKALKALGLENALNLDSGGSVALWSGGYKVGPGRDLTNAILFIKR